MDPVIHLDKKDNVATSLADFEAGFDIEVNGIVVKTTEKIPFGFKVSMNDIKKGEIIYKYGEVIGRALTDIPKGSCVHIHNIASLRGVGK